MTNDKSPSMREGADSVEAVTSRTAPTNESQSLIAPLPWRVRCDDDEKIEDVNGFGVVEGWANDCEFIVRVCNGHADLIAALKLAGEFIANCDCADGWLNRQGTPLLQQIEAAIAKAEGR